MPKRGRSCVFPEKIALKTPEGKGLLDDSILLRSELGVSSVLGPALHKGL